VGLPVGSELARCAKVYEKICSLPNKRSKLYIACGDPVIRWDPGPEDNEIERYKPHGRDS
jgi:hypothetical protein